MENAEQRETRPITKTKKSPVTQLVEHLADYPADVIDARKLLRRYQASPQDFATALQQLEQERRE